MPHFFETQNDSFQNPNTSFESQTTDVSEILADFENKKTSTKIGKNIYLFLKDHPLYDTHALRTIPENDKIIPNFIGTTLPRCDQGD